MPDAPLDTIVDRVELSREVERSHFVAHLARIDDLDQAAVAAATRLARQPLEQVELRATHAEAGRLEHLLRDQAARGSLVLGEPVYEATGARFDVRIPIGPSLDAVLDEVAASGITHELIGHGPSVREVPRRGR